MNGENIAGGSGRMMILRAAQYEVYSEYERHKTPRPPLGAADLPRLVLGVLTVYHFSSSCLPLSVAAGMLTSPT